MQQELHERMIEQSPLKSGPSTVNGSPEMPFGSSVKKSEKKVAVPVLNLEPVFEQQRRILEAEKAKKMEEARMKEESKFYKSKSNSI